MFDFENTPITHYTKLKAQYNCGPVPVLPYDGSWAKITLKNGTKLEVASEAELNALLVSTSTATVASTSVNVSDITKIEFGTSVTSLPSRSCMLDSWSSLKTVSGFHEGLKTIGDYCFTMGNGGGWGKLSGNTIVLPSTVTSIGQLFLCACGDGNLRVVVNCPVSAFGDTNPNYLLSAYDANNPQYVNGIKIGGRNAATFIEKYPNRVNVPYRNLYNVNSLTDFKDALESDNAEELYPAGTEMDDSWGGIPAPLIVAQYLDSTNNANYYGAEGVILIRKYMTEGKTYFTYVRPRIPVCDYGQSDVLSYLQGEYYDSTSDELKSMMSDLSVTYIANETDPSSPFLKQVSSKWHLLGVVEAGRVPTDFSRPTGILFDYWKLRGVPEGGSNAADTTRFVNTYTGLPGITSMGTFYRDFSQIQYSNGNYWATGAFISRYNWADAKNGIPLVDFTSQDITTAWNILPMCFVAKSTSPSPTEPGSLSDLKRRLQNGTAERLFPVGTEIPDTWNGQSNPLIVAQYLDSSNNSSYGGAEGVMLVRKYIDPAGQKFNNEAYDIYYDGSVILDYLNSTYLNNCSDAVKAIISEVAVPYYDNSSMTSVLGKWHLMSAYEVCNQGNSGTKGYEGIMWDLWQQRTELSSPNGPYDSTPGRAATDRDGNALAWWLRSRFTSYGGARVNATSGSLANTTADNNDIGVLPVCFVAKD